MSGNRIPFHEMEEESFPDENDDSREARAACVARLGFTELTALGGGIGGASLAAYIWGASALTFALGGVGGVVSGTLCGIATCRLTLFYCPETAESAASDDSSSDLEAGNSFTYSREIK